MRRKTIGDALEGACDARLTRRGGNIKWDVHDNVYYGDASPEAENEQAATVQGVIGQTGEPSLSCQQNYDPLGGYVVAKKALYQTHLHVQVNLLPASANATRDKVYIAIRQQGVPQVTSVLEDEINNAAATRRRQVSLHHIGMFLVDDVIDVLVWLDDDVSVNQNVTFSIRSLSIVQIC